MPNMLLIEDMTKAVDRFLPFEVPDFKKRLRIWSEVEKYRWKEDESIWRQKVGKSQEAYEVYFDGEFVCFFDLSMTSDQAVMAIIQGMLTLFKDGKIFVNEQMYAVKKAAEEEKNRKSKEVELIDPTTPEEKVITEVLKRTAKKSNKKVVLRKSTANVIK